MSDDERWREDLERNMIYTISSRRFLGYMHEQNADAIILEQEIQRHAYYATRDFVYGGLRTTPQPLVSTRQGDANTGECEICLESTEGVPLTDLSCGHVFHTDCINTWCKSSTTCPKCRAVVKHDSGLGYLTKQIEGLLKKYIL